MYQVAQGKGKGGSEVQKFQLFPQMNSLILNGSGAARCRGSQRKTPTPSKRLLKSVSAILPVYNLETPCWVYCRTLPAGWRMGALLAEQNASPHCASINGDLAVGLPAHFQQPTMAVILR